jgi:hypothetical protein
MQASSPASMLLGRLGATSLRRKSRLRHGGLISGDPRRCFQRSIQVVTPATSTDISISIECHAMLISRNAMKQTPQK